MLSDRPFYVLRIYLGDKICNNTRKKYVAVVQKRNKEMLSYHEGNSDMIDAGVDLYVPTDVTINNNTRSNKIDMGVVCSMTYRDSRGLIVPCGFYLYPRSSTGSKTPLRLSNSVGVIDAGYRGNIIGCFDNVDSSEDRNGYSIKTNDRLVQLCAPNLIYPIVVELISNVDDLDSNDTMSVNNRGTGGFGSTGD